MYMINSRPSYRKANKTAKKKETEKEVNCDIHPYTFYRKWRKRINVIQAPLMGWLEKLDTLYWNRNK